MLLEICFSQFRQVCRGNLNDRSHSRHGHGPVNVASFVGAIVHQDRSAGFPADVGILPCGAGRCKEEVPEIVTGGKGHQVRIGLPPVLCGKHGQKLGLEKASKALFYGCQIFQCEGSL